MEDYNIKMDLNEVWCKDVNLKGLVHVCVRGLDVSDVEYLGSTARQLHQRPFSSLSEQQSLFRSGSVVVPQTIL
jgi:hypothetical protein